MPRDLLVIGLISDTHNRLHPRVPELFGDVDEIWHLGDVCEEPVLEALATVCPRLTVVLGNNDRYLNFPLTRSLQRGGENFHLIHIPPEQTEVKKGWLLFGHTHVPYDQTEEGVRWFNPGSAGLANKGAPLSLARLIKRGDSPFTVDVVKL